MKLSMKEKKILYAYGCPSHHNTVTRLKWLTALTVDPEANPSIRRLASGSTVSAVSHFSRVTVLWWLGQP